MPHVYSTRPITEDQIDLAYLLVEAVGRDVDANAWASYCRRVIEWRGATGLYDDVIVVTDSHGHIKGLFVAEFIQSLLFGRVLDVPMFITVSAGDEDGIILDLLEAVKARAHEANCRDIRIWTQGGEGWARVTDNSPTACRYKGVQIKVQSQF